MTPERHDRFVDTLHAIQDKLAGWLSSKIADGSATAAHMRLAVDLCRWNRIDARKVVSDPVYILANSLPLVPKWRGGSDD